MSFKNIVIKLIPHRPCFAGGDEKTSSPGRHRRKILKTIETIKLFLPVVVKWCFQEYGDVYLDNDSKYLTFIVK